MLNIPDGQNPRAVLRRTGRWMVGLFWTAQFAELTILAAVQGRSCPLRALPTRVAVVAIGAVLTLALIEISIRLEGKPLRLRLSVTTLSALGLCGLLVAASYGLANLGISGQPPFDPTVFVCKAFTWFWFFLSVAAAFLALTYSLEAGEREARMTGLEAVATEARIAALRYQLNPHFLFNTLNSVAALIGEGRSGAAEEMVENLSDFLRATLELDSVSDITLARELELQNLYLAIEQVRFPDRLRTTFDLPPELRRALVPALITQPLIENVIRHAVARSQGMVTISISAAREQGWLLLTVENDGGPRAGRGPGGTGVGLANVVARLEARFGAEQVVLSRPLDDGGFRTELRIPFRVPA